MGIIGKLVSQTSIKSGGDVFHEIFKDRPHHISGMAPDKIQNFDLHDGQLGAVGSVLFLKYTLDGQERLGKQIVEAIDEEKKSITFKVIEGELLKQYETFKATVHVDTSGEDNIVTWTFEYEKLTEDVPEPNTLMDFCINLTKDIENHHLSNKA